MLLRKGVYPYEYIDEWDKFNEKIIPSKESFYSDLTLENISKQIMLMQATYSKNLILII